MTLKDEFYKMYHNPINDDEDWEDIWQWIEEKIKQERAEERNKWARRIKTVRRWLDKERNKAIDDCLRLCDDDIGFYTDAREDVRQVNNKKLNDYARRALAFLKADIEQLKEKRNDKSTINKQNT